MSHVHAPFAVWTWLLLLLSVHLALNYAAVRSVSLKTLNCQRASFVLSALLTTGTAPTPEEVSKRESILRTNSVLRWHDGTCLGRCKLGVHFQDFCDSLRAPFATSSSSCLRRLLYIFRDEQYVLWHDYNQKCMVLLYDQATNETKLKAWCHALRASKLCQPRVRKSGLETDAQLAWLESTLQANNQEFDHYLGQIRKAGWSLSTVALETNPCRRLRSFDPAHA